MFVGYQQIVAGAAVKTASDLTIPSNAVGAQIQADTNDIRYTLDGTIPSASKGMILLKGDFPKEFLIEDIKRIKFIRGVAADADLNINYFGTHDIESDIANGITVASIEYASQIDFLAGLARPSASDPVTIIVTW